MMYASARNITNQNSAVRSEFTHNRAVISSGQPLQSHGIDVLADKPHRAVSHQSVDPTRMPAEWLIVGTTVVVRPEAGWRSAQRSLILIDADNSRCRGQGIAGT